MKRRALTQPFQKKCRSTKGFTIIELLIGLAIFGLIATALYSVLGNTYGNASVQQAATKIADDMRSVNDAAQKYYQDKVSQATAMTGAGSLATTMSPAGAPYINAAPVPPAAVGGSYAWDNTSYTNTWGTATADTVIKLTGITSLKVCQQINSQFAGAAAGATPPTSVTSTLDMQCFGASGGPYTAVKTIYIN